MAWVSNGGCAKPAAPPGEISYARFEAREISCSDMLMLTSNPPKRQIGFTLDDTHYIAMVVITDNPPRAMPARERDIRR